MKKCSLLMFILVLFMSCDVVTDESSSSIVDTSDWVLEDYTHGDIDPNYSIVFPDQSDKTSSDFKVLEFHIAFDYDDWYEMQYDLDYNINKVNNSNYDYTPVWVPCTFKYDYNADGDDDTEVLTEWYKVGIRYKGNSSLQSAYRSGNNKLSFKLDFDEFEDDYSEIDNQRFFGFKQLNLNNNFDDESFLRESVASDLFREFGLVSAETTFCIIYLDSGDGDGEQYYGIYTIVEEVDDTVIETQLDENFMGNLYKPDGDSAQFSGNYTWDEEEMEVKNEGDDVYDDTYNLYTLMSEYDNYDDKTEWVSALEQVLDVDTFLKWFAANAVMQNWDTYGNMSHNFYLYNLTDSDADTSLLTWIPWDNNEAFLDGKGEKEPINIDYSKFNDDDEWPLIGYILDQNKYQEIYDSYISDFIESDGLYFDVSGLQTLYGTYEELLTEWANLEVDGYTFLDSKSDFSNAIDDMVDFVSERYSDVYDYLY